jgi:hypothetical protein
LAKRAVSGDPDPAVKKGDGGYADWVIVAIHGLREYLDLPYRRLLDLLHEMHDIVEKLGLDRSELPDFYNRVRTETTTQDGCLAYPPSTFR